MGQHRPRWALAMTPRVNAPKLPRIISKPKYDGMADISAPEIERLYRAALALIHYRRKTEARV